MRVRSLLLGTCMVVVPALALFSHHVPPEVAAAVRRLVSVRLSSRAEVTPVAGPQPAPPVPAAAPAPPAVAAADLPPPASAPSMMPPVPPGRRAIEDRLLELGASAIECQPLPGGGGVLLASCRVAADPSGQLQRLFQAVGPEPTAALEILRADVEAWRNRIAARAPAVNR